MTLPGLLVVDKPAGVTSHDVVGRARRILGTRKIGHAGTLDPMATGVLILGVDRATRLLGHLALADKRYAATIRLGQSTVSDDADGEVIETAPSEAVQALDDVDIREGLSRLTGTIQQRPSAVSAIKVDGRRAYDRVRSGETVDLVPRTVHIARIDVAEIRWLPDGVEVDIDVECSTGTYVRAIARDLGEALGVGGHLTALRRLRVGSFTLDQSVTLERLAEDPAGALLPIADAARRAFATWTVEADAAGAVRHGRRIPWAGPSTTGPVAVFDDAGDFLALAADEDGVARYLAVFVGP